MAEYVLLKPESANSCCKAWKDKYIKLEEKRNALRQAVKLLEQQINKIQAENLNLKKGYEEVRTRASIESEGKEKESAVRVSLEKEILDLKSQISSFEHKNVDALNVHGEVKHLNGLIADGKKEIDKLKQLLETEKRRADAEKKNAETRKEEAAQAWNAVKAERSKISDLRKSHKIEAEKANECRQQIEILKEESEEAKLKLACETSKLKDVRKELEVEKLKTIKEKEHASSEISKAEALRIQAEAYRKEAAEERSRADKLFQQLERKSCRIAELQKKIKDHLCVARINQLDKKSDDKAVEKIDKPLSEMIQRDASELKLEFLQAKEVNMRCQIDENLAIIKENLVGCDMKKSEELKNQIEIHCRKAMEEKCRADQLSIELEESKRKVEELQEKLHKFKSSRNLIDASNVSIENAMSSERAEMKLLKKKLKFEKRRIKHARQVADLEKSHRSIIKQELDRVKLEFVQLANHMDTLHKFASAGPEDTDDLGKTRNAENLHNIYLKNLHAIEPFQSWMPDTFRRTHQHIPRLLPLSGGNYTSYVSGIQSRLESLPGDSNRKMLQSCAIDSSTASFSDGQLLGSQGKSGLDLMTAAKLGEQDLKVKSKRSNLSGEVSKIKCNENPAMVAENSVKSPIKDHSGRVNDKHQKRKRILETVESIGCLFNESKKMESQIEEKLSLLHALNSHTEKPLKKGGRLIANAVENSLADHKKFQKKRKASFQKKIEMPHLLGDNKMKLNKLATKVCLPANVGKQPSQPVSNLTDHCQPCLEELNDTVFSQFQTLETFGNVVDGDYMRLLNLDSAADEECYRRAMERPLSPTLPDIYVSGADTSALNDFEPLVNELHKGLLDEKDYQLYSRSYDVINTEIKSNYNQCNDSGPGDMLTYRNKGLDSFLIQGSYRTDSSNIAKADDNCLHQVGDVIMGAPVSSVPTSVCEKAEFLLEIKSRIEDNFIPYTCVQSSNSKDCYSTSRIFSAIRACTGRCSVTAQKQWMVREILAALKMERELLPEEKTCVFFSLLLLNFTIVALHKYGNFLNCKTCLDAFSRHISEAMLDMGIRSLFAEVLCLDKLLVLIEDFIIDGRVLSSTDASLETLNEGDARVNILLDGINRTFSLAPASTYYLVAGSTILASISKAVDRTSLLCGVSYNILRMCRYESSLMLIMLHVFAHIGGDQFFSLEGYSSMMVVLKSIVMHLEGVVLSDDATLTTCKNNCSTEFIRCANCPFAEKVMAMPMVVSFLLGSIQKIVSNEIMDEDLLKSSNSLNFEAFSEMHKANQISSNNLSSEEVHPALPMECNDSCGLNKNEVSDDQTSGVFNASLCEVSDAISLIELLACYMSWNWTCVNIIPQLLKILELSAKGSFTLVIVILLGQLGRLGVDAEGFEDEGVEILRFNLSAFLCLDSTIKSGLSVQIAVISSLLGLLPFDFETIIQDKVRYSAISSQYVLVQANLIKKWFSLLSPKQKEMSVNILRGAGCNVS